MASLIDSFDEIRLLQLIDGNKNHHIHSVWENHFGTALLVITFCLLFVKGFVPSFPQWLSLIDMNWYWATDSCSSTPAYLQTLSQYLSLLGCINLRAVTTTGKLFCGINIIMWYKSERTQKSLVKATVVRCQCWAATKHKLNQCQQCHIVSVIQYDKVLVVAYQPPRCWTMGTFLLLTITLICAKQWLVLPICAYLLLIDTAQA